MKQSLFELAPIITTALSIFLVKIFYPNLFIYVRTLFPKWGFFDKAGADLFLEYRVQKEEQYSEWKSMPSINHNNRTIKQAIYNPKENLKHLHNTILRHLLNDCMEANSEKEIQTSPSYLITKDFIKSYLKDNKEAYDKFQFKLIAVLEKKTEEVITSETFKRFK